MCGIVRQTGGKMQKSRIFILGLAAMLSIFFYGCDQIGISNIGTITKKDYKPVGTIIAKVDNMYITLEQLNQEIETINNMAETPEQKITTPEQKINYLKEELIRRYLFYKEAKNLKLDQVPANRDILMNLEARVLDGQFMTKEIGSLTASDKEVEQLYNDYKNQYFKGSEERKTREIVLETEDAAKEVLIELLRGTDFALLASQRSIGETASKGGELGYLTRGKRGEKFAAFDEVVFSKSMQSMQISNIFKNDNKWYIVRVESIREGKDKSLNEVFDDVKKMAIFLKQQQKLKELKDNLTKQSKIEIYQEKIK